jgi:hypothetical protein
LVIYGDLHQFSVNSRHARSTCEAWEFILHTHQVREDSLLIAIENPAGLGYRLFVIDPVRRLCRRVACKGS